MVNVVSQKFWRGAAWTLTAPFFEFRQKYLTAARFAASPNAAERHYWSLNDKFLRIYDTACRERVDLWLANDWTSLPIARRLAAEQNVPFAYDTHELAVDEYAERRTWRLIQRPLIASIERLGIREAAFVSCVSEGIAQRLAEFHGVARRPLVIRSMPAFESIAFRPTGNKIRVLYHGIVAPGRALDTCIESVRAWRPEFHLTIRGPGTPEYLSYLEQVAHENQIADRVTFDPPVPTVDLVRAAGGFDVGLFALAGHSLQNVYVLPNKFFEYIMAGLALCVSDLPEMTRLLKKHELGVLIDRVAPQSIAAAINSLDSGTIDACKLNSLATAREFNWENESRRLLNACNSLFT